MFNIFFPFFMTMRLVGGVLLSWLKFSLFVDVRFFLLRYNIRGILEKTSWDFGLGGSNLYWGRKQEEFLGKVGLYEKKVISRILKTMIIIFF